MKNRNPASSPGGRAGRAALAAALLSVVVLGAAAAARAQQKPSRFEIERGRIMLQRVKDDLEKNYYDPTFRGMDLAARVKQADEMIKQANSNGQMMGIIAQLLVDLDDSHTFFIPPQRVGRTDYGWDMQMIGEKCYVVGVRPGSDAEAKGLKEGDEVLSVDGLTPTRRDLWKIQYLYNALRPANGMRVIAQGPGARPRQLDVMSKVTTGKRITDLTDYNEFMRLVREEERTARLNRHRYYEVGKKAFVWKMPQFDLPKEKVDDLAGKFRKFDAIILDLRGNGGGAEETLLRLIGHFVERDVKIGELKRRKEAKPLVAKAAGDKPYQGKLVVLVDSESGSSSELFARVMQLEKRATVIGDRTAGAVMRAKHYGHQVGVDTVAFYSVSVTDADLIMTDGQSLEHRGVTPDEVVLPSGADMAARRDPVLARAAAIVGLELDAQKAGALFPVEWRK